MRKLFQITCWLFLVGVLTGTANAAPITLIHETNLGQGSGSIGGRDFNFSRMTITAQADTDNIIPFSRGYLLDHSSVSINIAGVGTYSLLTGTRSFLIDGNFIGLGLAGGGLTDLFIGPRDIALNGWDMTTSVITSTGPTQFDNWHLHNVQTSSGRLIFNPDFAFGRFQAITQNQAVPAPGAAALLLLGLALTGFARYRRS